MKSNIFKIYSEKCALEITNYSQLEEMKSISISPARLGEIYFLLKKIA